MPAFDDPIPRLQVILRSLLPGVTVSGERPSPLLPHLPCVVVSTIDTTELASYQAVLADQPLINVDCYADGDNALPDASNLAGRVRRALFDAVRARLSTGPLQTPDADEDEGVRRVTVILRYVAR